MQVEILLISLVFQIGFNFTEKNISLCYTYKENTWDIFNCMKLGI